jgi:hypothetical protein
LLKLPVWWDEQQLVLGRGGVILSVKKAHARRRLRRKVARVAEGVITSPVGSANS